MPSSGGAAHSETSTLLFIYNFCCFQKIAEFGIKLINYNSSSNKTRRLQTEKKEHFDMQINSYIIYRWQNGQKKRMQSLKIKHERKKNQTLKLNCVRLIELVVLSDSLLVFELVEAKIGAEKGASAARAWRATAARTTTLKPVDASERTFLIQVVDANADQAYGEDECERVDDATHASSTGILALTRVSLGCFDLFMTAFAVEIFGALA
jgi:hypothetical protein